MDETPMANAPQPERHPWVKRHGDDEWVDEIRFRTVPRFKESELSGSEWRVSVTVEYLRKGVVVCRESYSRMTWAIAHVAVHAGGLHPGDFDHERLIDAGAIRRLDQDYCMQPGCSEPWTVELEQTHQGCGQCGTVKENVHQNVVRRFCDQHRRRGDSDLDDNDDRYRQLRVRSEGD